MSRVQRAFAHPRVLSALYFFVLYADVGKRCAIERAHGFMLRQRVPATVTQPFIVVKVVLCVVTRYESPISVALRSSGID